MKMHEAMDVYNIDVVTNLALFTSWLVCDSQIYYVDLYICTQFIIYNVYTLNLIFMYKCYRAIYVNISPQSKQKITILWHLISIRDGITP